MCALLEAGLKTERKKTQRPKLGLKSSSEKARAISVSVMEEQGFIRTPFKRPRTALKRALITTQKQRKITRNIQIDQQQTQVEDDEKQGAAKNN